MFSHTFLYLDGRDIPGFGHVFLYRDQMDKTSWFLYFLYRIADENLEVWIDLSVIKILYMIQ